LDVHLHQRLLHALYPAGLLGKQRVALASDGTHHAHLVGRAKRRAQDPRLISFCSHWQSCTSLLRPGTYFICRASTK